MYSQIPAELRERVQWVVAGQDKVPLDPGTGRPADVTNPRTWGTFAQAVRYAEERNAGIGFVFTPDDPYTFIDLDAPTNEQQLARHQKIYNSFASYTELSRSGTGVHIIVRGTVPSGARRDKVEMYPHGRYAIMTGHVLKDLPIADQQALLDLLYTEMHATGSGAELVQVDSHLTDRQVWEIASSAANGDKFDRLCRGEWQEMSYPSQSEADFALLSILAFYTHDNEQVRRLFRMSALGQRPKAQRNDKYLNYALQKIRAGEPKPVDLTQLRFESPAPDTPPQAVAQPTPATPASPAPSTPTVPTMTLPPGLMGQLANYIYWNAVQPMPEAALAGAISLMAGIAGRAFNTVTKTGLNQYVILVAETGSGKEGAAAGIDALLAAVRPMVPSVSQFKGPATLASGQALLRVLERKPVCVAVLGEIGLLLKQWSSPNASNAELMLRRVLLDLYTKSGAGRILDEMAYSDREKNTQPIASPTFTILGESSPEIFYGSLEPTDIEQGLVPRFLVIEHHGSGEVRNKQAGVVPDPQLVKALADMATQCLLMQNNFSTQTVAVDAGGQAVLDEFEALCDGMRRESGRGAEKELWSRSYLKALRLASLVAVGVNWSAPVVDTAAAQWACALVRKGTDELVERFAAGDMGAGEMQWDAEIRKAVKRYMRMTKAQRLNAKCPKDCVDHDVVPFAYLRDQLRRRSSVQLARVGPVRAVQMAISDAIEAGVLVEIPPAQRATMGTRSRCFAVGDG